MKTNRYVHIVPLDEKHSVIFNGMTKDFLRLSNDVIPTYRLILANPDDFVASHPTIIYELKLTKPVG